MTEEMKTCDFYNEKICTLFSKYFDFNVECENLFLSTIDCDIERECPIKRLEQELKWANDEEKYLKECCIKAGKELEKNSFAWDGKEKNLVVQALELNERYEILKQENKDLKDTADTMLMANDIKKQDIDSLREANDRLEQENKELKDKKDKYYQQTLDDEILMNDLSLEVDLRKKESDFYLEKLSKYRSALEEIKNYCDRIEQGSVIGTQDCLINSIKNITNEVLNEKEL